MREEELKETEDKPCQLESEGGVYLLLSVRVRHGTRCVRACVGVCVYKPFVVGVRAVPARSP